jgi:hypothetical protein
MDVRWVAQVALSEFAELTHTPKQWFRIVSASEGYRSTGGPTGPNQVSIQPVQLGVKCIFEANGRRFHVFALPDGRVAEWHEAR